MSQHIDPRDAQRVALAEAWIAQDPDPETRDELAAIIAAVRGGDPEASADLADRFDTRLAFGTAGLRGAIAAGPNRMNRVLVAQAAAGLAAYLVERATPGSTPSIVIGYDGRKNSDVFARDTAEIMAGAGVRAVLLPRLLPTPVLAFAVRHLGMSAGVMVTASHNPPNDNGYKVYLGGDDHGSQIVAPADAEIAAHITRVAETHSVPDLPRGTFWTAAESVIDEYVRQTALVASPTGAAPAVQPAVVYTAMHGVGWQTMSRVLEAAGFDTADPRRRADRARRRFPHCGVPESRGAGRHGPQLRAGPCRRRRAHRRERPRRRSARDRHSRSHRRRGLPAPHRQRGRADARLAGRTPCRRGARRLRSERCARLLDRLVARPRGGRERLRPRLRGHAHGLQVDLARAGARLRLRGGARLPRESRRPCATKTASRRVWRSSRWRPS